MRVPPRSTVTPAVQAVADDRKSLPEADRQVAGRLFADYEKIHAQLKEKGYSSKKEADQTDSS